MPSTNRTATAIFDFLAIIYMNPTSTNRCPSLYICCWISNYLLLPNVFIFFAFTLMLFSISRAMSRASIWYFTSVCFCKPAWMCEEGFWSRLTFIRCWRLSVMMRKEFSFFRIISDVKSSLKGLQEWCSTMGRSFMAGWMMWISVSFLTGQILLTFWWLIT